MRYFILYSLLFFSGLNCFSQENNQDQEKESYKYNTIEKKPEFPGGMEAFFKYIGNNYKTPKVSNLSGKIYINFVIEKDGAKFVVDIFSAQYLTGSKVDYKTEKFDSQFVISNPNAKSTCGCGSSFNA